MKLKKKDPKYKKKRKVNKIDIVYSKSFVIILFNTFFDKRNHFGSFL